MRSRPYFFAACRSSAAFDSGTLYEKATPLYPAACARGKRAIMRSTSLGSLMSRHTKSQRFCRLAAFAVGFGVAATQPKQSAPTIRATRSVGIFLLRQWSLVASLFEQ